MERFHFYGNSEILNRKTVAIFSSQKIPLAIFGSSIDLFESLLNLPIGVAGGWHSPLEKYLLKTYHTKRAADLIILLAKSYDYFRLPEILQEPYKLKKVLIIEPPLRNKRITKRAVNIRDQILEQLINNFLFLYVQKNGRAEMLFFKWLKEKKKVFILNHPLNKHYFLPSVKLVDQSNIREVFNE